MTAPPPLVVIPVVREIGRAGQWAPDLPREGLVAVPAAVWAQVLRVMCEAAACAVALPPTRSREDREAFEALVGVGGWRAELDPLKRDLAAQLESYGLARFAEPEGSGATRMDAGERPGGGMGSARACPT